MAYKEALQTYVPRSSRRVLLVWPNYYSKYPPLGLLKLSAYHRQVGDQVHLVRPPDPGPWRPDLILVTSLFTYAWKSVHDAISHYHALYPSVPIFLGGIYASLMEEHAKENIPGVTYIHKGLVEEAEKLLPDYSLLEQWMPDWDASIMFTSRGCVRRCPFCAVPRLEPDFVARPSVRPFLHRGHRRIVLWDNNFLASPYAKDILKELSTLRRGGDNFDKGRRFIVDFNQGLDARLLNADYAQAIRRIRVPIIRLAYDQTVYQRSVKQAIDNLKEAGINPRKIIVYAMYNYRDTPQDFLQRVQELLEWGVAVYPMRYQPLDATSKDEYVGEHWTPELLEMVAKARRVLGTNGAWPPYEALKEKFINARTLVEALTLRPPRRQISVVV